MSYLLVHITGMHFRQGMLFEVVQHLSKYKELISLELALKENGLEVF